MKRLKGPQLSKPEMKVPPVLMDLYQDLRDRRLLPLLALLVVATLAVPFLLGDSSGEEVENGAPLSLPAEGEATDFTVVEATPGLRDYRRRLRHRTATNPFKQRYSGPVLDGAELQAESGGGSSSTSTSTSATFESAGTPESGSAVTSAPAGSPSSSGGTTPSPGSTSPVAPAVDDGDDDQAKLYSYLADIQISRTEQKDGRVAMGEPTDHLDVEPLTPLPGRKAPVVTFLGATLEIRRGEIKTERALLMVSKDVTAAFGDAKCVTGTDSCELLEVEPGFPETFEYGPNNVRYKINVIKIHPTPSDKP